MNTSAVIMNHVSMTAADLSQRAHTAYWIGCSGKTDSFLQEKLTQDFERLADLLGYEVTERPKPIKPHQTNTEPSRRALSADDLADIAYDEHRDALEAAE